MDQRMANSDSIVYHRFDSIDNIKKNESFVT